MLIRCTQGCSRTSPRTSTSSWISDALGDELLVDCGVLQGTGGHLTFNNYLVISNGAVVGFTKAYKREKLAMQKVPALRRLLT